MDGMILLAHVIVIPRPYSLGTRLVPQEEDFPWYCPYSTPGCGVEFVSVGLLGVKVRMPSTDKIRMLQSRLDPPNKRCNRRGKSLGLPS